VEGMSATDEAYELLYRDLVEEQRTTEDHARAALPCCWCGSPKGMEVWSRENIMAVLANPQRYTMPEQFWRWPGEDHDLFIPCPQCNPSGQVPEGYEPVDGIYVEAWLRRRCQCPDCRREREEA